ncbi:ribonucleases P/MRP protein subunit POP1-domain-containing protein [Xylariomycetidae sp. FL2044]|nr:ribonucleases P/MRP protein subunit POP1-domain-containing protein [Xylariomycetidae sp. FL2044]
MPPKESSTARPGGKAAPGKGSKKQMATSSRNGEASGQNSQSHKRKNPPQRDGRPTQDRNGMQAHNRAAKRAKLSEIRAIPSQPPHAALQDGELNVQSFVGSLAFEINALDESMQRTRTSATSRAFQKVPFHMRRRAAAHNHRKVPRRLHARAKREMIEDNTPTVNDKTRKPKGTRARLRAETAKRLDILARRKRLLKLKKSLGEDKSTITTRAARPKIRRNEVNDPLVTAVRYRKRQVNKTWLPTHLWHAKRARMTPPKEPLWRFAIPLTPTRKLYRPTHRTQWSRGAIAWDMSYMSTIGLFGSYNSIQHVLKSLGLIQEALWNDRGNRWRAGAVHWTGILSRKNREDTQVIGPASIMWNPEVGADPAEPTKSSRQLFIRIHPSSFQETFNELLRLVKMFTPRPYVQDLRFEIGSIDLTGPESTEALLGVLKPYFTKLKSVEEQASRFESLAGLRDPNALPTGSLLAFSIRDPRLHYPSRRTVQPSPSNPTTQTSLLQTIARFHQDAELKPNQLFDRDVRFKASRLPSQKSLNRRRSKSAPGTALEPTNVDPPIPIILLASRSSAGSESPGSWTVILPWKCVLPVWYSLMHFPLSTGGNPLFGGLNELRQLHFERGQPWFPGDMPGTNAGKTWELDERQDRKKAWDRMPKGKRVNWDTLDLGAGRKGELGLGWACDYEKLFGFPPAVTTVHESAGNEAGNDEAKPETPEEDEKRNPISSLESLTHLSKAAFRAYLSPAAQSLSTTSLVVVRIRNMVRGVPSTCARIYRLPDQGPTTTSTQAEVPATEPSPSLKAAGRLPHDLRDQWLAQKPPKISTQKNGSRRDMDAEVRRQLLARKLISAAAPYPPTSSSSDNMNGHPLCPGEEDLIGFITTGSFNLRDAQGEGIGSLSAVKAMKELKRYKNESDPAARLCVVRNAGEKIGRLAKWELL